jgi:hypothetical protein
MTRETKIGLIVAGSFLCLVCIVVASKWKRGDVPGEGEEQSVQVAAAKPTQNNTPTPEVKKKEPEVVKQKDTSPHVTFPAIPDKGHTASGDNKQPSVPMPPPLLVPPPLTEADRLKLEQDRQKKEALNNLQPMPIVPPPGTFVPPPIDIGKPNVPEQSPMPLFPITQEGAKKGPADQVGVIPLPPKPLVQVEEKKPLEPAKTPSFGSVEIPPPVVLPPNGNNFGPPPIVETKQPNNPGVKPEGIPTFPPLNTPPAVTPFNDKDQPPAFPSANPPKEGVPTFPALTPPSNKDGIPPTIPKNPTPTFPPAIDTTPMPIPRIGGNELPSAPPITIGSGIGGSTKPLPTVRDVNNTYVCQAGDTSFAILSLRLYRTEKYADALQAYNRDHAQFIKNGNALLTNPPSLAPGQQVEYPSLDLLERNYRSLIREGSASTIPTIPAANAVNLAKPSPLAPGIAAISNPPSGATRNYRVQNAGGESILDIAERQLGNRGQWTEIYRINQANPVVRPPALIPAGTDLKLP